MAFETLGFFIIMHLLYVASGIYFVPSSIHSHFINFVQQAYFLDFNVVIAHEANAKMIYKNRAYYSQLFTGSTLSISCERISFRAERNRSRLILVEPDAPTLTLILASS